MKEASYDSTVMQESGLLAFHPSYRSVDWHSFITRAQKSLNIMVYYWDQWIEEHQEALVDFLKKPETTIQFFFADDSNPNIVREIKRLFPKHSEANLRNKIRATHTPLQKALKELNLPDHKVQVYKLPHTLNYSMQCIDDKILILSFFEMYRQEQVDSPALIVDLQQSPQLLAFYTKELRAAKKDQKKGPQGPQGPKEDPFELKNLF